MDSTASLRKIRPPRDTYPGPFKCLAVDRYKNGYGI